MKRIIITSCFFFFLGCAGFDQQNKQPPVEKYFSQKNESIEKIELIELETRKYKNGSATQKFIFIKPPITEAAVILFEGGVGQLELSLIGGKPLPTMNRHGFLARNRELFAKHNLMVALIDAPSDLPDGLYQIDRISDRHITDMKAVIDYMKNESDVPIWAVAMSNSPLSAINLATKLKSDITGIVFASIRTTFPSKWAISKTYPNGLFDIADTITVPTLIVHHKYDKCKNTLPFKVKELKNAMVNCPNLDLLYFQGGKYPEHPDCWPLSPHGFYGIEDQVIKNIAGFIKENS
jgi:hypothetical protein